MSFSAVVEERSRTMEEHQNAVRQMCRVCGQRLKTWCARASSKAAQIKATYNVDTSRDEANVHPQHLCKCCDADLYKATSSREVIYFWESHNDVKCQTCEMYRKQAIGGRPKKKQTVAALKVKARKDEHSVAAEVENACDVLLSIQPSCNDVVSNKLQKIASFIVKDMLKEAKDGCIQLPTGGPKLSMTKAVIPRITSSRASKRTIQSRNQIIDRSTRIISGGIAEGRFQMTLYIQSRKELREQIIPRIKIPNGHELAMKAALGWSWRHMRRLKKWLKLYNIKMAGETATRVQMGLLLEPAHLQSTMLPFIFKQEDGSSLCKEAPMVYIPDIISHIKYTLDRLDSNNMLTWDHHPTDRILVKIGADHGGGTTKAYYNIINVDNTNSCNATTIFSMFEAPETQANLHIALDRFVEQVNKLESETWRGMGFEVYMCGDYEIIRKFLGLQGASATYPCFCCTVRKENINNTETYPSRTLAQIIEDSEAVEANGNTVQAKQKHHSVFEKPFFNIPIEKVCPPALHISLGLWQTFFDMLVRDVQCLGEAIADELADMPTSTTNGKFSDYIQVVKDCMEEVQEKRTLADELRDQAVDIEFQQMSQALFHPTEPSDQQMKEVEDLHKRAKQLDDEADGIRKKHKLSTTSNPLLQKLDTTLASFKVRRQAYFGGIFNGNHVDKCLKADNYEKVLDCIVEETRKLTTSLELDDRASAIKMRYMLLFEKFSACHAIYSTANPVTAEEIHELERNIDLLINHIKHKWPKKRFTPKLHLLYKHVVPFMKRVGFGLGKFADQGGGNSFTTNATFLDADLRE
ncbi:uncharacterized protein [Amphiura filiformis]|uniref:uncharacterized protein n=1 Tax=Amphiura filiformis TaxID=82378 RepID=UPI003B21D7B5